jgi:hypothetical protein
VITDAGGPDEFGYTWIDSDEPGGPVYDWVDISDIGEELFMYDNNNQGPFWMEFDFPFYGHSFSSFRICSNGWISFTSSETYYGNQPLPGSTNAPENLIAPFWDDMNPEEGGKIYYHTSPESVVVSWVNIAHVDFLGPYSYQVILTPDGGITMQYDYLMYPINSATIGIQDASQTIGLQIACNQDYAHDELAIRINTHWLGVSLRHGEIMPGEDLDINAILDATMLEPGIHTNNIVIFGYDINHELPTINVPVTLDVMTDVEENMVLLPESYSMEQNYPNPFNAKTEIRYALPVDSKVRLEVYNVLGQKVITLVDEEQKAGYHSLIWDGTNESEQVVSSGLYLYKLVANEDTFLKKMIMLK